MTGQQIQAQEKLNDDMPPDDYHPRDPFIATIDASSPTSLRSVLSGLEDSLEAVDADGNTTAVERCIRLLEEYAARARRSLGFRKRWRAADAAAAELLALRQAHLPNLQDERAAELELIRLVGNNVNAISDDIHEHTDASGRTWTFKQLGDRVRIERFGGARDATDSGTGASENRPDGDDLDCSTRGTAPGRFDRVLDVVEKQASTAEVDQSDNEQPVRLER